MFSIWVQVNIPDKNSSGISYFLAVVEAIS